MTEEQAFRCDEWHQIPAMLEENVKQEYDWVTGELDTLLERHGYRREGHGYGAFAPNNETIVLFCHFGVS